MILLNILMILTQLLIITCLKYKENKQINIYSTEIKSEIKSESKLKKYTNLVWFEEFNSENLSDKWIYDIGGSGWGNHELQYYKKDNIFVKNGNLVIVVKKEHFGGNLKTIKIIYIIFN